MRHLRLALLVLMAALPASQAAASDPADLKEPSAITGLPGYVLNQALHEQWVEPLSRPLRPFGEQPESGPVIFYQEWPLPVAPPRSLFPIQRPIKGN